MENIDQDKISEVESQYHQYIDAIDEMISTGRIVIDHISSMLNNWLDDKTIMPVMQQKIENYVKSIEIIKDNGTLDNIYKPVYKQSIVLLVSGFEMSMTNIFSLLVNEYPEIICWDNQSDKKLGIDINLIRYYSNIGDIISRSSGEINFQDLQSTKRFLEKWLDINIDNDINRIQDNIILAEAERNIIIHNGAVVDANFLRQVRNTQYCKNYSVRDSLNIDKTNYNQAKEAFNVLFISIINAIKDQIKPKI